MSLFPRGFRGIASDAHRVLIGCSSDAYYNLTTPTLQSHPSFTSPAPQFFQKTYKDTKKF